MTFKIVSAFPDFLSQTRIFGDVGRRNGDFSQFKKDFPNYSPHTSIKVVFPTITNFEVNIQKSAKLEKIIIVKEKKPTDVIFLKETVHAPRLPWVWGPEIWHGKVFLG